MKILLSYVASQSVEYCFWKYFFQSTGIWIEERCLKENEKVDISKIPQLVLLDHKTEKYIYKDMKYGILYCLPNSCKVERADVIKKNVKRFDYYKTVLKKIFTGQKEEKNLQSWNKMLHIFVGKWEEDFEYRNYREGVWTASWIVHEINYVNDDWNDLLLDICGNALDKLENMKSSSGQSWNYGYMRLYCEYLSCAINNKKRNEWWGDEQILLNKCQFFAQDYGWKPMLSWLVGRICLLSALQCRESISFFQKALSYAESSDIYYAIAHVYEKSCKDMKKALKYYQKAYECDENNYRALYKFGIALENREMWLEAVSIYIKIQHILEKNHTKNSISVQPLEYDYKTCRRIIYICEQYITEDHVLGIYRKRMEIFKKVRECVDFTRLIGALFESEEGKSRLNELINELELKIEGRICRK